MQPAISVLLPVYNCEKYIREAVDSILNQTFTDFEFLIIDDASTDGTLAILKQYTDPRIRLIKKPHNSGHTNSLNHGLSIAKGKYIVRMDGDDISLPERFEKQYNFMEANEDIILCATQYKIIGTERISNHPVEHEEIKVKLIIGCYIAHPTVMFRKLFFDQNNLNYNPEMEPAEDYELWSRLVFLGKLHNLDEVLLEYRVHNQQTSNLKNDKQTKISQTIKESMLRKVYEDVDVSLLQSFKFERYHNPAYLLKSLFSSINQLVSFNNIRMVYLQEKFVMIMQSEKTKFCKLYYYQEKPSLSILIKTIYFCPFFFKIIGFKKSLFFSIKCLLK